MIHLLIDLVNITSIRGGSPSILGRVFRLLARLLRRRKTEKIVLQCMTINKPAFGFLDHQLDPSTLDALNEMLELTITGNYVYELVLGYETFTEMEIRGEKLHPFRYESGEYGRQV